MSAMLDDAERLLSRARADLKALCHMGDQDNFDDNIYGFHAQQAVEKALKAWLACLRQAYPFRHDLGELLAVLAAAGQDVESLWMLTDLTPYAVQLRYDQVDDGPPLDRPAVEAGVAALVSRVERLVPDPLG
jgi:HEPN domain-containing protein